MLEGMQRCGMFEQRMFRQLLQRMRKLLHLLFRFMGMGMRREMWIQLFGYGFMQGQLQRIVYQRMQFGLPQLLQHDMHEQLQEHLPERLRQHQPHRVGRRKDLTFLLYMMK